jgi:F0F1-type ATP synthase membrane subunit b/b'
MLEVPIKLIPPQKPIKKQLYPMFKGLLFGLIFAGIFSATLFAFATYGTDEPYPLGNTLTPDCTPGAEYCTVVTPAQYSFGANNFSGTGGFTGGSLTIDTDTLYVDATNNYVGIGTASPGYPLHVVGNQYLESGNLGIGATPYTYGAAGDEWIINADRTFTDTTASALKGSFKGETYWNPSADSVLQYVSGLTFSLNSTPGATVNNTGYFQAMEASALWRSDGTITHDRGLVAKAGTYNSGSSTSGTVTNASAIYAYVTKATGSTITNAYGLYLQAVTGTDNAYGVYIDNVSATNAYDIYANDASAKNYFAGSVGIGTTSPGFILDIQKESAGTVAISTTKFGDNTYGAGSVLRSARGTQASPTATQSGDAIGGWSARGYGTTEWAVQGSGRIQVLATENFTDSAHGGKLTFDTVPNGSITAETRMTIDQNGKVGIGTTSPDNKLTVANGNFNSWLTGGSNTFSTRTYSDTAAENSYFSAQRARGSSDSPAVPQSGDRIGTFLFSGYNGTNYADAVAAIRAYAGDTFAVGDTPGYLSFFTTPDGSGTELERMKITSTGYVGIANTSPGAYLDIGTAGTTLGTMRLEGSTSGYVQIQPAVEAGSWTLTLPANDGDNGQVLTTNGSGVSSWTTPTVYQASDATLTALAGLTTAQGDLIYSTGTDAFSMLNKDTNATRYLSNTGTSNNPAWAQIDLSNGVTGVLPLANGGTAKNLTAANGGIVYTDADSMEILAATATANQVLLSGSNATPAWSTATYPATATGTGTILRADGTNWVATTATYPDTITANYIPYATGSNTISSGSALTFDGATLNITGTSAAQQKLSYNGSIYTTFTTGSDGTLTIANTGGATGDIVLNPTGVGDVALLSDTGVMAFGGNGNTNNEDLSFDFETTANTVAITSSTGVSNIKWTGNLTLGGNATIGTLVTRVATSAPTEADVNGSLVINDSGDYPGIYYRYGGAWHYSAETGGFQIPGYESADPISGEKIEEGDIVLGMINKTYSDDGLHGVWVKWDSVKAQLLAEARGELSRSGTWGTGSITDVKTETLLDRVTNVLTSLGISVKDGITSITQLAVERFSAKNARVQTLEMVDKATGEVYCSWIENGEMVKARGECGSIEVANANPQPVGQSIEQAQQIIQKAQQAASNALETTQHAQEAVEQNAQQAVEQAAQKITGQQTEQKAKEAVKEAKEEIKQEIKQELAEEQQTTELATETSPDQATETTQEQPQEEQVIEPTVQTGVSSSAEESQPQPEAEIPVEPEPILEGVGEIIENAASGLLNGMWEFLQWIFGATFKTISRIIPEDVKNSTAGVANGAENIFKNILKTDFKMILDGAKSAPGALLLPIQNLLGK